MQDATINEEASDDAEDSVDILDDSSSHSPLTPAREEAKRAISSDPTSNCKLQAAHVSNLTHAPARPCLLPEQQQEELGFAPDFFNFAAYSRSIV